jgi:DNA-binding MarR family transcriptional regulator
MSVPNARMQQYIPLIREFSGRLLMMHSAVAESLGLHATDIRAIRLLRTEPLTAGALGEGVGLTGAATTALIDRLEKAGYVVRERETLDRRKVTVRAVPEKLREVDAAYGGMTARMTELLSTYTAAEFSTVVDFVERATQVLIDERARIVAKAPLPPAIVSHQSRAGARAL